MTKIFIMKNRGLFIQPKKFMGSIHWKPFKEGGYSRKKISLRKHFNYVPGTWKKKLQEERQKRRAKQVLFMGIIIIMASIGIAMQNNRAKAIDPAQTSMPQTYKSSVTQSFNLFALQHWSR